MESSKVVREEKRMIIGAIVLASILYAKGVIGE